MNLSKLSLIQYRSFQKAQLSFSGEVICFYGKNGAGKTNLLDAIHYLCLGKSYFHPIDKQNVRMGDLFFRLDGSIIKENSKYHIEIVVETGKRKRLKKNDVLYPKLADHVGAFPVVVIAPDDIDLINGASDERRRFLDNLLSQTDHSYLDALIQYNRLLSQRNAALKKEAPDHLLDVYGEQMSGPAALIHSKRHQFLQEFAPIFTDYQQQVSKKREQAAITYKSQLNEGIFLELTQARKHRDRLLQRTSVGVHRDDLNLLIGENELKKYGSQGQKKTFLVGMKLSMLQYLYTKCDTRPILLLDDIFDKLDDDRAGILLDICLDSAIPGQVYITDTSRDKLETLVAEKGSIQYFHLTKKEGNHSHVEEK